MIVDDHDLPKGTVRKLTDWVEGRTNFQRLLLVLFAGLVTGFSFAPFYVFPLLWVSYPLLLLVILKSPRFSDAFSYGWWFAFGQLFFGTIWIGTAFEVDSRYPGWVGYLAVACLSVLMALYAGFASGLLWRLFRGRDMAKSSVPAVISFAFLWNLAEWLRGHLFTGFPWNLAGYIWGFSDVMLQSTAFWGIYGLGIVTILLALVPYLLLYLSSDRMGIFRALGSLSIIFIGMIIFGFWQLSEPTGFNKSVKMKIIQANINQKDKWDPDKKSDNFITHLEMSHSKPEEGITHVIWPETAVIYFLDTEPSRRYLIADMLNENSVLMTGFPRVQRIPAFQAWNSFAIIDADARVQNIYDKAHLVPFGEYTPDILSNSLSFLGLGMLVEGFSYSRGEGIRTLHQDGTPPVGVMICYEIIFPGAVVDQNDRPDWILNITNDAWYGTFNGPYQHLVQTRVRAIEEGLPVVRSAGTGVSAVIDSYGRIVDSIALNQRGVITSHLPVKRENITFYSRYGDWVFFCFMLLLSLSIILFQRQRDGRT